MQRNTLILLTTALLLMMFLSCSSDRDDNGFSPLVNDLEISAESQRELLGVWRLKPDFTMQSTKVEFARDLAAHYDITQQIPAPTVSNESYDGITQIYQVDLTINNTGLGQDAFDVRLIVYTDNDGHELKNPDNWTALYDMPEGSFINPFKAYATGEPSRRFANAASHTETVSIYLPGGILYSNIVLAIDASIPSNCDEPYLIDNFTQEELASGVGSNANITIDVYDWQADVDSVKLHCTAITGNPTDSFSFDSGNTWSMNLVNNNGMAVGDYLAMISATSTGSGNLELYDVLSIAVTYSFQWVRTWGDTSADYASKVITDNAGILYVAGSFMNTVDFGDGNPISSIGNHDAFLCKFDTNGNLLWVETWGGNNIDSSTGIVLDSTGNVYVIGHFYDSADFGDGNPISTNGQNDIFLNKFDTNGNFQWVETWGDTGYDSGSGVIIDTAGNVYVVGDFMNSVDFGDGNPITSNGERDVFLLKLDSDGGFLWVKTWGGSSSSYMSDGASSVIIDTAENVYVAGCFSETVDFSDGNPLTSNGARDAYLCKFDSNGNFQWVETWGDFLVDGCQSACSDNSDNIYVSGFFEGTVDFGDGSPITSSGGHDVFLSKFDSSSNLIRVKTYGSSSNDLGHTVTTDSAGSVYTGGRFSGTVDFGDGNPVSTNGDFDAFLLKLDSYGTLKWVNTWGGSGVYDWTSAIITDSTDSVYVYGCFESTVDFGDGSPITSNGVEDIFLVKLSE